ncbi:hypothetical protein [Streptomyces niveus]|uniref:Uncharacterized protein n=1 Tax=Streptomyces niveus TaxID=193462 RepID=A0ABZ2AD01_STRNV|nr:hypothetical protein [Streptomyces niveus]
MTEQQNPEQHPAVLELARVRASLAAGLTVEQSARLLGSTDEELTADAQRLATELGAGTQTPPAHLTGGPRGVDVSKASGVEAGAQAYREKHPPREPRPVQTEAESRRNPYAEPSYTMNSR